jgi:7-cyano-7-deazaguanine synthase in queuosine biosynthesis
MSTKVELNPPETPRCPVYDKMNNRLHNLMRLNVNYNPGNMLLEMAQHCSSCPVCQARKSEFDKLARNAKEPEVKNE